MQSGRKHNKKASEDVADSKRGKNALDPTILRKDNNTGRVMPVA